MLLSGVLRSLYLYTSSSAGNGELEITCQNGVMGNVWVVERTYLMSYTGSSIWATSEYTIVTINALD
jgi:hypothetical protein